jgi:phage tail-like protein
MASFDLDKARSDAESLLSNPFDELNQPQANNLFSIMIGGDSFGFFTKVSGMEYSVAPYQIKEGGRNMSPHYRPFDGPGTAGEVTLEWGSVRRDKMESWVQSVAPGMPFRRHVFITQYKRNMVPYRIIVLSAAWPKQWKVSDLDSNGNDLATESVTLVHEGMFMVAT